MRYLEAARRRPGTSLTIFVYALLLGYGMIVLFGSVVGELYGQAPQTNGMSKEHRWCVRQLNGLKNDLNTWVTKELRVNRKKAATEWMSRWETNYGRAYDRCAESSFPELTRAFELLGQLSESYTSGVKRVLEAREQLAPSLSQAIGNIDRP